MLEYPCPKVDISIEGIEAPGVTVIAAWNLADSILLGADTRATSDDYAVSSNKLYQLQAYPLMWGGSGDMDLVMDFKARVDEYDLSEGTWSALIANARKDVAFLNKTKRQHLEDAGIKAEKHDLFGVLLAGYLKGEPNIVEITESGVPHERLQQGFEAIGSGAAHFAVARWTLQYWHQFQGRTLHWNESTFQFLLAVAAEMDPRSGQPLRCYRITDGGITELRRRST